MQGRTVQGGRKLCNRRVVGGSKQEVNSRWGSWPGKNAEKPHLEQGNPITVVISPIHFSGRPSNC